MRRALLIALPIALIVVALVLGRRREAAASWYEAVAARRADVVEALHQVGELAPRDPLLVKARFNGRIQFIVADGTWVDAGAPVVSLAEDDEVKEAADARSQLLGGRQELRLARTKRRHAEETEGLKLAQAARGAGLERLRHRILTSTPVGGEELVRLDAALVPLEAATAAVRGEHQRAQVAFQRAQDAYLEALDARSAARDALMRLDARIDELAAAAGKPTDGLQAADLAERDKAAADLITVRAERATAAAIVSGGEADLRATRAARDATLPSRAVAAASLATREEAEEDLRVRIEIEKRGLPLANLRLDEEGARLESEEAARKRDQGRAASAAGALSQAALAELEDSATRTANQLDIVRARVAIAARPLTTEQRAEADARLARAESKSAAAQADRDRALALADQEIAVLEARVTRLAFTVDAKGKAFPEILESNLDFVAQELAALDPDDADDRTRKAEAEAELATLRAQLEQAKADPPNVIVAPAAGVARVRKTDDRPRQAGDQVWEEDVLVEIFTPGNMEVRVLVNEVDVRKVAPGQRARVTVPALPGFVSEAEIIQVAGLGRDKFADDGQVAGLVQFPVRVRLAAPAPTLRQGMTALVDVTLGTRAAALMLPLGAVTRDGDGWSVLAGDAQAPTPRAVQGEPFADDAFLLSGGLAEGEAAYILRKRNQ